MCCDIHHGLYGASLESKLKYVTEMPSLQKAISVTGSMNSLLWFWRVWNDWWSSWMIPSYTKWLLSCQELPDFHNLDLYFYFVSTVCTYWSYRAFPKSKVPAVTLITERCLCFWLSSSELFRKALWEYISFHKVKLMFSFPSKLIMYVLYKAWMGIWFFLMAVYFCHQICFTGFFC